MKFLGEKARKVLKSLAEGFLPRLSDDPSSFLFLSANQINLSERIENYLSGRLSDKDKKRFNFLLLLINYRLFCGVTSGIWKPFLSLNMVEKEKVLQAWESSSRKWIKSIFQVFKQAILYTFYNILVDGKPNPTWSFLGFSPYVISNLSVPKGITPLEIKSSSPLTCDVLVIGSGAGGGVVAAELAQAGFDVIVVEKGEYLNENQFNSNNLLELYQHTLEKGGFFLSDDKNLIIGAGSVLGGGTTINYTGLARPPVHVLQEWAEHYQFTDATSPFYQYCLDQVAQQINYNKVESKTENKNCALLEQGCKKLNYSIDPYYRNVNGCIDCSFCYLGCRYGAKQDMVKTYLQDAFKHGARILVKSYCQKILHEQGVAKGASVLVQSQDGKKHDIQIRAKLVVSAAGSLHTPALLLRSGLVNPHIGKDLTVHPASLVSSVFDEPVNAWHGACMTRVSRQFMDADGSGYGALITTPAIEPGFISFIHPWISARTHREMMLKFPYSAFFIALARDYYGGQVKLNKQGAPACYYHLHPYDEKHLRQGIAEAIRIAIAAGAKEVRTQNAPLIHFNPQQDYLPDYLNAIGQIPLNYTQSLGSAHLMSSCRIAGRPDLGAIKPTGETYEIRNLFVADGSALPTASGVNPMLTILGLAYYIAQQIKNHLNK